jgi:NADP-dependent 3-hydroxy acid dehydrogenase YdfG
MGSLDSKVAVVGATSGIGSRIAEVFVAEGAKIVIAGRRIPEGEALAKVPSPAAASGPAAGHVAQRKAFDQGA